MTKGQEMLDEWLSLKEVVNRSGYGESTVRRAIRRKRLKIARSGVRVIRVNVADFKKWMLGETAGGVCHV